MPWGQHWLVGWQRWTPRVCWDPAAVGQAEQRRRQQQQTGFAGGAAPGGMCDRGFQTPDVRASVCGSRAGLWNGGRSSSLQNLVRDG